MPTELPTKSEFNETQKVALTPFMNEIAVRSMLKDAIKAHRMNVVEYLASVYTDSPLVLVFDVPTKEEGIQTATLGFRKDLPNA